MIAVAGMLWSVTATTSYAGTIYAVTGASGAASSLYSVDVSTGAATLVGATGFTHVTGLEYDATTGKLFAVKSDLFDSGVTAVAGN